MTITNRSGNVFAATIGRRVVELKNMTKAVWQESMIELIYRMQLPVNAGGRMPVRTGFLRSSLRVSTSRIAIAKMRRPGDGPYTWDISSAAAFIRAQKVGVTLRIGYLAEYVYKMEYGVGDRPGYGFQRLAVQMWPTIVKNKVAEIKAR